MDAGLLDGILTKMTNLRTGELTGFEGFGETFNEGQNAGVMPRITVREASNTLISTTDLENRREVNLVMSLYHQTKEDLAVKVAQLETVLDRWSETPREISDEMDSGGSLVQMDVTDSLRTHERVGLWSQRYGTRWEISITR